MAGERHKLDQDEIRELKRLLKVAQRERDAAAGEFEWREAVAAELIKARDRDLRKSNNRCYAAEKTRRAA
eukprot:686336-Pleurochrysis_carterae.AAC.1